MKRKEKEKKRSKVKKRKEKKEKEEEEEENKLTRHLKYSAVQRSKRFFPLLQYYPLCFERVARQRS